MDKDFGDNALVFKTEVLPSLAAIGTFPEAVADGGVAADVGVAGADIEGVGVLRVKFDITNSEERLVVKNGQPSLPAVFRFPNAALRIADINGVRVGGVDFDGVDAGADVGGALHRPGRGESGLAAALLGGVFHLFEC